MKKNLFTILIMLFLVTACTTTQVATKSKEIIVTGTKVYKIGLILPLTGDASIYGMPAQKVIQKSLEDLNKKLKVENKNIKFELVFEDGRCNPKDALTAAQTLINLKDIKVIFGGFCSGETLGAAPFAEENKIIMLSPGSTSPEITNAGDYIFRNIGSDEYQAVVAAKKILGEGNKKIAVLSENTDYAQALREKFKEEIKKLGGEIVADEVVNSNERDIRIQLIKIKTANPDALYLNAQNIRVAIMFAKQITEQTISAQLFGNEAFTFGDTLKKGKNYLEGMITQKAHFDETTEEFKYVQEETGCELGIYCASIYDGVFLLAEKMEKCGEDTDCIKKELYNTKGWKGLMQEITFDDNGDILVQYDSFRVVDGELVKI